MLGNSIRVGLRRTLRLLCPGGWWIGQPSGPMAANGLVIWGAPVGAVVHVRICGTPIAGSGAGMPAQQFDPAGPFERLNALIDWPTLDVATGIEVELRTHDAKLITDITHPSVACAVYGVQVPR